REPRVATTKRDAPEARTVRGGGGWRRIVWLQADCPEQPGWWRSGAAPGRPAPGLGAGRCDETGREDHLSEGALRGRHLPAGAGLDRQGQESWASPGDAAVRRTTRRTLAADVRQPAKHGRLSKEAAAQHAQALPGACRGHRHRRKYR